MKSASRASRLRPAKPSVCASCNLWPMSAASHIAFFGTQPTLTQVPPEQTWFQQGHARPVLGRAECAGQATGTAAEHDQVEVLAHAHRSVGPGSALAMLQLGLLHCGLASLAHHLNRSMRYGAGSIAGVRPVIRSASNCRSPRSCPRPSCRGRWPATVARGPAPARDRQVVPGHRPPAEPLLAQCAPDRLMQVLARRRAPAPARRRAFRLSS